MFDKRKTTESRPLEAKPKTELKDSEQTPIERPMQTKAFVRSSSVIGASIRVKGDIEGDDDLVIDGQVDGSVRLTSNELTIGDNGIVVADIEAKSVKIDGSVTGDIQGSELVTVSKHGKVRGNITAPRVTLEDGAQFKGSIDMDPSHVVKQAKTPANTKDSSTGTSHAHQGSVDEAASAGR